jgi:hypothetical protein
MVVRVFVAALCAIVTAVSAVSAAGIPSDPETRTSLVGNPTALLVQPVAVTLNGPRAMKQIVVTGRYADNSVRDLTSFCEFTFESADLASIGSDGFLTPQKNGDTALIVKAGGQTAKVPVSVKDMEKPQPVRFRHDLVAALNVGGCNAGACHGTPSGKAGFRLSLRGYDPEADFLQLTRDVMGRRTDRNEPGQSLILQKALG